MSIELILALDIGTSSIRCSAYQILEPSLESEEEEGTPYVQYVSGSLCSKTISLITKSGKINLFPLQHETGNSDSSSNPSVFDIIDTCVDETLSLLRLHPSYSSFHIIGLGFSSFVMNLVGVDSLGNIIDPLATLSYACNTREVQDECKEIQRYILINYVYKLKSLMLMTLTMSL
jgi:hypothetical protein